MDIPIFIRVTVAKDNNPYEFVNINAISRITPILSKQAGMESASVITINAADATRLFVKEDLSEIRKAIFASIDEMNRFEKGEVSSDEMKMLRLVTL